jgi:hypothetical protein
MIVGGVGNIAAGIQGLSQALTTGSGGSGKAEVRRLRPEAKYLSGKKHGVRWTEGPAMAKSRGIPQGQWGSIKDLEYAAEKASGLKSGEGGWFNLPQGHSSVVHRPDGATVPATRFWVFNNGTGTFHGYPAE